MSAATDKPSANSRQPSASADKRQATARKRARATAASTKPAARAAAVTPRPSRACRLQHITLHGHRVAYRAAGDHGPVIVLVHGITSNSANWQRVTPLLAADHHVVAPDLFGHGESAKPRGDYSLGAHASGVRDLLQALGHDHATVVGHSLGGGVAMQLAYQYPDLAERLVLVCSGGLGRGVSPLLRAASLPGAELVLLALTKPRVLDVGAGMGRLLGRLGLRTGTDLTEVARGHASLADREARQAFLSTLRAIVDIGGQRVDARDRLYLAAEMPTLIVWGQHDAIIPVEHGRGAHALIPGSQLEVFEESGHYPHMDDPYRFAQLLAGFIATHAPSDVDPERRRELLRQGASLTRPRRAKSAPV